MTLQQAFNLALQQHQAGQLSQAEQLYRQILAQQPDQADALHYLGVIAYQMGRNHAAEELIRRAIALQPGSPEPHINLGNVLKEMRRLDEAVAAYRRGIALRPDVPEAHFNLGNALKESEQIDEAIDAYHRAICFRPTYAEAHFNLGNALKDKGQLDRAIEAYRGAVNITPHYPEAHYNLGTALYAMGQLEKAVAAFGRAIAIKPLYSEAHNNLGNCLREQGRLDAAVAAFRQAIAIKPNHAEAYNNLGNTLCETGMPADAIAACRRAIDLKPDFAEAHNNLGNALKEEGRLDEAIAAFRRAIAHKPGYADAHSNLGNALTKFLQLDEAVAAYRDAITLAPNLPEAHNNLAHALLLRGEFDAGWAEHEWRWRVKNFPSPRWSFSQPQWNGSDLTGRTILLHAEQGLGDTIQFIRYAPLLVKRGARVIAVGPPQLRRLLEGVSGIARWLDPGEPLSSFDVHCPLLSLPLAFGTTLETIPNTVPYFHADAQPVECWRQRLTSPHHPLHVGLAWGGSPTHRNDRSRSITFSKLAPLGQVPNVRFYNLQFGPTAEQARNTRENGTDPMKLIDWTADLHDFADTAALIANLDLVISVDTAVAHLAGALGKPVWTLLPFVADWRWLLDREDSPWYPTMRLFRQPAIGDWNSVVSRVVEALSGAAALRAAEEHVGGMVAHRLP